MASRTIGIILSLKDQVSKPIFKVVSKTKELEKETKQANNAVSKFGKETAKSFDKMVGKSAKVAAGMTAIGASMALKTGFGEAADMEGFRTQLETATKSAKKAGEIMKWSVDLANKTPFETGSIVEMSSKFEGMGMSAKKWGGITADMAGATNKDVNQAAEAIIDAQTGELERLKEFGITKKMISKKAGEMFRNQEVVNAKGQIVDQEKFNTALMQLMQDKYKGGAQKQAQTVKGMWSTITGVTKTSLANILGMQNDGTIKQGSLLELLKSKVQILADKLTQWQSDGTIQRIGEKITKTVKTVIRVVTSIFTFIKAHKTAISNILIVIGSFMIAVKIGMAIMRVIKVVRIAMLLLNGTLVLTPLGWIVLLIGAVIAIGVLLWKNWDKIKAKASELWQKIKGTFSGIKKAIVGAFTAAKEKIKGFFSWMGGKLGWLNKKIEGIPVIGELYKGFKSVVGFGVTAVKAGMKGYATGGIATQPSIFGEAGAEMAIPLKQNSPRSKQLVKQADRIVNGSSSGSMQINIHIDSFIGQDEFADSIGERISRKIQMAMANMA
ncbi:MAG: hypothetical protein AB9836_07570 [Aminipila sp.]